MNPRRAAVATIAAASVAAPARAQAPAPPRVAFVRTADPTGGTAEPGQLPVPAATDQTTGTVYYSQRLDPFQRAHEIGHVFDSEVMTGADRLRAEQIMGMKGRWNQGTAMGGINSPDEWFADYYAAAANNLNLSRQGVSSYAQLNPNRLKAFESWLAQLGRSRNLQPYQK